VTHGFPERMAIIPYKCKVDADIGRLLIFFLTRLQLYFEQRDIDDILKIQTSQRNEVDFIAWEPERRGDFTVHSAYCLALHTNMQRQGRGAARRKYES
jgi:hypothetical protein